MRYLLLPLLGLSVVGCSPYDGQIIKFRPDIVVSPTNLDFGQVIVEYDSSLPVEINNAGKDDLEISAISFSGTPSGAFSFDTTEVVVAPGDTFPLYVTFKPPTYLPYTDTILIDSNDVDQPEMVVRLFGDGVDGSKPDIAVDQLSMDFGEVEVGSSDPEILTVLNEGEGDLALDHLILEGSTAFTLGAELSGGLMVGGSQANLPITYTPTTPGGDHATLTITSNDPDESPLVVTLLGNGGGDYGFPVATFSPCPATVDPPTTLSFDASESYDPYGFELVNYYWDLPVLPDTSRTDLTGSTALTDLFVDVAGDYTAQLVVENAVGILSDPFQCSFTAIPSDLIHVELTWNTDDSDLDLHLVRSGAALFEKPGDVCYCNPNPSWGSALSSTDDPTLDLDDMFGKGPENINIEAPADDTYTVYVHYYRDNGGGDTTATVKVYLSGVLVPGSADPAYTAAALVSSKDVWEVGTITWPDGIFTPSDAALSTASTDGCE